MTQKSHMFAEMQRCGMARYSWNGPWTHTKGIYLFIKDVTEVAAACVSVMSGTEHSYSTRCKCLQNHASCPRVHF